MDEAKQHARARRDEGAAGDGEGRLKRVDGGMSRYQGLGQLFVHGGRIQIQLPGNRTQSNVSETGGRLETYRASRKESGAGSTRSNRQFVAKRATQRAGRTAARTAADTQTTHARINHTTTGRRLHASSPPPSARAIRAQTTPDPPDPCCEAHTTNTTNNATPGSTRAILSKRSEAYTGQRHTHHTAQRLCSAKATHTHGAKGSTRVHAKGKGESAQTGGKLLQATAAVKNDSQREADIKQTHIHAPDSGLSPGAKVANENGLRSAARQRNTKREHSQREAAALDGVSHSSAQLSAHGLCPAGRQRQPALALRRTDSK